MNMPDKTTLQFPHRRRTPSFSSSLLDAVLRSIDDESNRVVVVEEAEEEDHLFYRQQKTSIRTLQTKTRSTQQQRLVFEEEIPSLQRALMIEKWMENRSNCSRRHGSNSSSSDSSSRATFSSSETELPHNRSVQKSFKQSRNHALVTPSETITDFEQTPKREAKFMRTTKLRALKIYGDLNKKVKQPISPGGRISNFLNSIFTPRYVKKPKVEEAMVESLSSVKKSRSVKDSNSSRACASFSRSCLSKPPPPPAAALKRSVRFFPANVTVDEGRDPRLTMQMPKSSERKKRFADQENQCGRRESFIGYDRVKKVSKYEEFVMENIDDDLQSCSSSDLFELEVGVGAYGEELPVFGSTNLKTNQAIANGFLF